MLHKNVGIGDNHPTHNWEYADSTARTGATGFVAGDVHKLALQLDDLSLWILVDTTPTWQSFGAGYTDEQAQDAVGGILIDSDTVDFTYNDVGNTITAATKQQMSITSDVSGLKLSGDATSPGNNKVYGTDASGVKGWKADPAGSGGREILTAARTYYVRTDGSDSNNGLTNTAGGAFLTLQKALDTYSALDASIYSVTIQLADGTYTGNALLRAGLGTADLLIVGNSGTPANVILTATSGWTLTSENSLILLKVESLELRNSGGTGCLYANQGGRISISNVRFGTSTNFHASTGTRGNLYTHGNYSIVGNATVHWRIGFFGMLYTVGATITMVGTPAFSSVFAQVYSSGQINCASMTFSGSVSGKRYDCSLRGYINTGGAGTTYLPGTVAGTTATDGQYY